MSYCLKITILAEICIKCVIFIKKKMQKSPSAVGFASGDRGLFPPDLRRLGAFPPDPQSPEIGGFTPDPRWSPTTGGSALNPHSPHLEFLPTPLACVLKQIEIL